MAYRHYASVTLETVQDHERKCAHCGREYKVVCRAYGWGAEDYHVSMLLPDGNERRLNRASAQAQGKAGTRLHQETSKPFWHRCTRCGHYGPDDIQTLRHFHPAFKRRQLAMASFVILCGAGLAFTGVMGAIISWREKLPETWLLTLICGGSAVPCVRMGVAGVRDALKETNEGYANDPIRVLAWLRSWELDAPDALRYFIGAEATKQDGLGIRSIEYPRLRRLQCRYDFGPPPSRFALWWEGLRRMVVALFTTPLGGSR